MTSTRQMELMLPQHPRHAIEQEHAIMGSRLRAMESLSSRCSLSWQLYPRIPVFVMSVTCDLKISFDDPVQGSKERHSPIPNDANQLAFEEKIQLKGRMELYHDQVKTLLSVQCISKLHQTMLYNCGGFGWFI